MSSPNFDIYLPYFLPVNVGLTLCNVCIVGCSYIGVNDVSLILNLANHLVG